MNRKCLFLFYFCVNETSRNLIQLHVFIAQRKPIHRQSESINVNFGIDTTNEQRSRRLPCERKICKRRTNKKIATCTRLNQSHRVDSLFLVRLPLFPDEISFFLSFCSVVCRKTLWGKHEIVVTTFKFTQFHSFILCFYFSPRPVFVLIVFIAFGQNDVVWHSLIWSCNKRKIKEQKRRWEMRRKSVKFHTR